MAFFVRMLTVLSLACFYACSAEEENQGLWALEVKHRVDPLEGKSDDGKNSGKETPTGNKNRRSLSPSDRTESVTMMNNLRRTVGSSNMPYMTYDVTAENDAASWTFFCNFDDTARIPENFFWAKYLTTTSASVPTVLRYAFNSYPRQMSSVYLTSIGCDRRKCSLATYKGSIYKDAELTLCLFQGGSFSQFDGDKVQFKRGEGCTECDSGSFWCDYGLCRGDCSASDSSCYCNSYCLNCADTNRATCRCQCLEGWTGSRCETQYGVNATTNCVTTARVPKVITTINPNSVAPIGMSVSQLAFCAVIALFLGL